MVTLLHCDSSCEAFAELTKLLDDDLNVRYGQLQAVYSTYNAIAQIDTVVIVQDEDAAIGCGCFKAYDADTVEIKRIFVKSEYRGRGLSKKILSELESWAKQQGFAKALLETGIRQPEAISLYQSSGYNKIENYGQYAGMQNSVCFAKDLT